MSGVHVWIVVGERISAEDDDEIGGHLVGVWDDEVEAKAAAFDAMSEFDDVDVQRVPLNARYEPKADDVSGE